VSCEHDANTDTKNQLKITNILFSFNAILWFKLNVGQMLSPMVDTDGSIKNNLTYYFEIPIFNFLML